MHINTTVESWSRPARLRTTTRHAPTIPLLLVGLLCSSPTYAYIDPGTGSFSLQGLLASIAVALGVARTYWERIKVFFPSSKPTQPIETRHAGDGEESKAKSKT